MSFHDFTMKAIDGSDVSFDSFKGKHCLVVNVASECGLTDQYEGLQNLHSTYGDETFTVMGFPCNQFLEQEPGSDETICEFAQSNYGVTFPLFSKIEVNGDGACELYQWLKETKTRPDGNPKIAWNFTKFLIDGDGNIVERFEPKVTPEEIEKKLQSIV